MQTAAPIQTSATEDAGHVPSLTGAAKFQTTVVREGAKELNVLAALTMPHVMSSLFPPHYLYWWHRASTLASGRAGFPKLALGIPRGFVKTTLLKLLIVYLILFTQRRFILVICASEDLAGLIVKDVLDMLSHRNIRQLFGNWDAQQEYQRGSATRFFFRGRSIILKGVGVGTNFRGISENLSRPDVMIFDDAQTKDCAESAAQAATFQSWFYGTALKCKDPHFCFYLYVGNMYPKLEIAPATPDSPAQYGCLLKNLKLSPHWESIVTGAILSDGTSLWEEVHSIENLLAEYAQDKAARQEAVFLAEVMNFDDAVNIEVFDETKVEPYPFTDAAYVAGRCLIVDPSLGKKSSDRQAVGLVEVIEGRTVVRDLRTYQVSAPQLVQDLIDRCLSENISAIAIESYAYQATLGQWFQYFFGLLGITHINVILMNKGGASKVSAIMSMFKEVMTGQLLIHPSAFPPLLSEIQVFDPQRKNNEDGYLDVAAYANKVAVAFPQEIAVRDMQYYNQYTVELVDRGMNYSG